MVVGNGYVNIGVVFVFVDLFWFVFIVVFVFNNGVDWF